MANARNALPSVTRMMVADGEYLGDCPEVFDLEEITLTRAVWTLMGLDKGFKERVGLALVQAAGEWMKRQMVGDVDPVEMTVKTIDRKMSAQDIGVRRSDTKAFVMLCNEGDWQDKDWDVIPHAHQR